MFNFTSKIQTIIIYVMASLLIGVVSSHIWTSLELRSVNSDIDTYKTMEVTLKADVDRAVSAEKSCKFTIDRLVKDAKQKYKVIKKYKARLKEEVGHEKINSIDDFITHAKRLQHK